MKGWIKNNYKVGIAGFVSGYAANIWLTWEAVSPWFWSLMITGTIVFGIGKYCALRMNDDTVWEELG